jgi:hypothetical protein
MVRYRTHNSPPPVPHPQQDRSSPCSHPTFTRSILMLSSHLRLGLPSELLPSGFPTKTPYAPLISPIRVTFSGHLSLLNLITKIIRFSVRSQKWNVQYFRRSSNIVLSVACVVTGKNPHLLLHFFSTLGASLAHACINKEYFRNAPFICLSLHTIIIL